MGDGEKKKVDHEKPNKKISVDFLVPVRAFSCLDDQVLDHADWDIASCKGQHHYFLLCAREQDTDAGKQTRIYLRLE